MRGPVASVNVLEIVIFPLSQKRKILQYKLKSSYEKQIEEKNNKNLQGTL